MCFNPMPFEQDKLLLRHYQKDSIVTVFGQTHPWKARRLFYQIITLNSRRTVRSLKFQGKDLCTKWKDRICTRRSFPKRILAYKNTTCWLIRFKEFNHRRAHIAIITCQYACIFVDFAQLTIPIVRCNVQLRRKSKLTCPVKCVGQSKSSLFVLFG